MATPISDTLELLRELNKNKASRRKTASDQLMQMTKMSNEKDIKLLSTKIGIEDRKRQALQSNLDRDKIELEGLNDSIRLIINKTEMITSPLETTTGSTSAVKSVQDLLDLMEEEVGVNTRNLDIYNRDIGLANEKLTHYKSLGAFLNGAGVSDFDKSGSIDEDDVTLGNYFKSNNIDESNLDIGTMRVLESLGKDGYRDIANLQKLDTAYKKELQESTTYSKSVGMDKVQDFITLVNAGTWGDYQNSKELYRINLGQEGSELYEERYNQRKFALSVGVRPSLVEASVKKILQKDGSLLKDVDAMKFLKDTYEELRDKFAWDSWKYNKDLDGRRKKLLDKASLSNEEIKVLQSIELKQSVLEDANTLSRKYIKILNAASDPSNPVPTEFINEIEEIYSEYLESEGTAKKETGELLRDLFGFNPESREDVEWIHAENVKSTNDSLTAVGLDDATLGEDDVDDGAPLLFNRDSRLYNPTDYPPAPERINSNSVTSEEIESNNNALDIGASNEQGLIGPSIDDYDDGDTSFFYETIPDSSDAIKSLDAIENDANNEAIKLADYKKSNKGFVTVHPDSSANNELNLHESSLGSVKMATVIINGEKKEANVNWVTGDVFSVDGVAMGTLDENLQYFPLYNDSSSIIAEKSPVVAASGIQDKDYIRITISTPVLNLKQKIESGEIANAVDFIDALKDFVMRDDNGYKLGESTEKDDGIDLLNLFFEETNSYSFGNPFGKNEPTLVEGTPQDRQNQRNLLKMIDEVINEYKSLMEPVTIRQYGINKMKKDSGDPDGASVTVNGEQISQDLYQWTYPPEL